MNDVIDTKTAIVSPNNDVSYGVSGGYLRTYEVPYNLNGCDYFLKNLKYLKTLMITRAKKQTLGQAIGIGAQPSQDTIL